MYSLTNLKLFQLGRSVEISFAGWNASGADIEMAMLSVHRMRWIYRMKWQFDVNCTLKKWIGISLRVHIQKIQSVAPLTRLDRWGWETWKQQNMNQAQSPHEVYGEYKRSTLFGGLPGLQKVSNAAPIPMTWCMLRGANLKVNSIPIPYLMHASCKLFFGRSASRITWIIVSQLLPAFQLGSSWPTLKWWCLNDQWEHCLGALGIVGGDIPLLWWLRHLFLVLSLEYHQSKVRFDRTDRSWLGMNPDVFVPTKILNCPKEPPKSLSVSGGLSSSGSSQAVPTEGVCLIRKPTPRLERVFLLCQWQITDVWLHAIPVQLVATCEPQILQLFEVATLQFGNNNNHRIDKFNRLIMFRRNRLRGSLSAMQVLCYCIHIKSAVSHANSAIESKIRILQPFWSWQCRWLPVLKGRRLNSCAPCRHNAAIGTWSGSMPCRPLFLLHAVGWMVRYMEYPWSTVSS